MDHSWYDETGTCLSGQHSTATIAPRMSATIDEPGIMDSGANISIMNDDIVNKFHLIPQRWVE